MSDKGKPLFRLQIAITRKNMWHILPMNKAAFEIRDIIGHILYTPILK